MSLASKAALAASFTPSGVFWSGSPMVRVHAPGVLRASAVNRRMPDICTFITAWFKVSSMGFTLLC